jgi:hypothetical protein
VAKQLIGCTFVNRNCCSSRTLEVDEDGRVRDGPASERNVQRIFRRLDDSGLEYV